MRFGQAPSPFQQKIQAMCFGHTIESAKQWLAEIEAAMGQMPAAAREGFSQKLDEELTRIQQAGECPQMPDSKNQAPTMQENSNLLLQEARALATGQPTPRQKVDAFYAKPTPKPQAEGPSFVIPAIIVVLVVVGLLGFSAYKFL